MNKLKTILPLVVLALLVLAACTNPLSKKPVVEPVKTTVSTPAQDPTATVATAVKIVDSIDGKKPGCNLLKDSKNRQACEIQINDLVVGMLKSEIFSSFDLKRCKELESEIVEDCEERISATGVVGPISEEDLLIFGEVMHGASPEFDEEEGVPDLVTTYDSSKCAELKTAGYKEYCEEQIAKRTDQDKLIQIFLSQDVARCNELKSEDAKANCVRSIGTGLNFVEPPVESAPEDGI